MCDCKKNTDVTEQDAMVNTAIKTVQGLVKSKTAWGNVVGMPTILLALQQLGIVASPFVVGIAYVVANLFLRSVTKTPLSEK